MVYKKITALCLIALATTSSFAALETSPTTSSSNPSSPQRIDMEYDTFIKDRMMDYGVSYDFPPVGSFERYVAKIASLHRSIDTSKFSPEETKGPYNLDLSGIWWGVKTPNVNQGWKIHVSAKPNSAKKIADIAFSLLAKFLNEKRRLPGHKVANSIASLRSLNGMRYIRGEETQAGKFFVIYSEDAEQAYEISKALDQAILSEIKRGNLTENDFVPLTGDAKVGRAPGLYVRYGDYVGKNVQVIDPSGQKLSSVEDDRLHPWPDFMNKNGQWSDAKTPFKELPFSWVSPTGTAFTWQTRPISWKVGEPTPSSDRRMTYSVTDDEEVLWDNPNPPETNKTSHISRYKRPKWEVDALENGNISDEDAEADQEDK